MYNRISQNKLESSPSTAHFSVNSYRKVNSVRTISERWEYPGFLIVRMPWSVKETWQFSCLMSFNIVVIILCAWHVSSASSSQCGCVSCENHFPDSSPHCEFSKQVCCCATEPGNLADICVHCSGTQTALKAQFDEFDVFSGWEDLKWIILSSFQNNRVAHQSNQIRSINGKTIVSLERQ